jgi:hypothetical protein
MKMPKMIKFKKWELQLIAFAIGSGVISLILLGMFPNHPIVVWIIGVFTGLIMAYIKVENETEPKDEPTKEN